MISIAFNCFVGKVTFTEFSKDVVTTWSSGIELDPHWREQHKLCCPCYIKYDFIGHFENLKEDVDHVLTELKASEDQKLKFAFPFQNTFQFQFKRVPVSQQGRNIYASLSRDLVRQLIGVYKIDYELFGYDYSWACKDC